MNRFALFALPLLTVAEFAAAQSPDLLLTDATKWPGVIMLQREGELREVFRRDPTRTPDYTRDSIPRVTSVALASTGETYIASGLDGLILRLDREREHVVFHGGRQIRDLAADPQRDILFFSVVPTPRDGAPLADGEIYRINVRSGGYGKVFDVRQADLDHNFWGAITVHRGQLYLATVGRPSRVYRLTATGYERFFETNACEIQGLDFAPNGVLYLAGTDGVVRFVDGRGELQTVASSPAFRFADVALPPESLTERTWIGIEFPESFKRTGDHPLSP